MSDDEATQPLVTVPRRTDGADSEDEFATLTPLEIIDELKQVSIFLEVFIV
jgi:hypothetical protein